VIETLRIENLALVERVELEFGPGLNVLTGETGAGKSIVLGALGLLAGARAESEAVRSGADEAVVEAVFRIARLPALEAELRARGLDADLHELVVRRSVSAGGRSRAQVAGRLVPASTLAELLAGRLEISSQHGSQALLRPESHGELLDAFGGLEAERSAVAAGYAELRRLDHALAELESAREESARREDFLGFQVREIDEAKLVPGELAALAAERTRLAHAERLAAEAAAAAAGLAGEGAGGDPESAPARDRVAEALRRLDAAARIDPELGSLGERLRGVAAELADVAAELERYASGLEADPERLGGVEERLALLERLRRKYGPDEATILGFRERAAEELAAVAGTDQRLAALARERVGAAEGLARAAARLTQGRREAADRLARAVEPALHELALPGARFEVALEPAQAGPGLPCGPAGAEAPEFRFSANAGEAPRGLRRVASGGELSRLFLALKNVLRRADPGMVLVFDEVDAGIGGRVADRVGRVLEELAGEHQVLCITHLPQVAARGATHFRVEKLEQSGRTVVRVRRLAQRERVEEIARMAGGETVSDATRRHARELLRSRP